MTTTSWKNSALTLTYNQLSVFSGLDNFWQVFDTAFGTQYNRSFAEILRLQWQAGDFSQLPQIEILDSSILGTANGAYASSTNKIYLSNTFLETATSAAISAVLLEEIGHFVDAQINTLDSAGDEGAIFAELVQGYSLDTETLQALKAEDDHAVIILDGQSIAIEQQNFIGTAGNDVIVGTSGDDTISPGTGKDTIDGGAGTDTLIVDYSANDNTNTSGYPKGISSSNNNAGGGNIVAYKGNVGDYDQVNYSNIEQLNITGTKYDDIIYGGSGNDILKGGTGNDTLYSNGGVDILDGGDGIDLAVVDLSSNSGNNNLDFTQATTTAANGTQFINIERVNLTTGAGNDTIVAGNYDDTINSGAGNDTITSGTGKDTIDGGAGTDTLIVDYSANDNTNTSGYPKGISSSNNNAGGGNIVAYKGNVGDYDQVNYSNIEQLNITGTKYDDIIYGGSGNDILKGGTGNDNLYSNGGVDILDGGDGIDLAVVDLSSNSGNNNLDFTQASTTAANGTQFINIERVNLTTGAGNDTINSGTGQDTIDGGAGTDTLIVDYSANDNTNTSGYPKGISSSNNNAGSGNILAYKGNVGDYDQVNYSNIEQLNITGTKYDDILTGLSGNDILKGGTGNDNLYSNGGVDILDGGDGIDLAVVDLSSNSGNNNLDFTQASTTAANGTQFINIEGVNLTTGAGNDTINSGTGKDTIDGGAGTDTLIVDYSANDNTNTLGYPKGISSSNNNAGSGNILAYKGTVGDYDQVSYSNIEQLNITGTKYDDDIRGGSGNDILKGVNPNSSTPGLGEIDVLTGGTGSDRFILGNATKVYYDDGNTSTNGSNDYANITDFNTGDIIQLQGTSSNYLLAVVGADTQILINKPNTEPDELIGIVRNKTGLSLTGTSFNYVSNATLPTITLAVAPSSVTEDGTPNLVYTFTRTGSTTNALTVNYGITGTAASTDYTGATPGTGKTITFAAGSSTATLTIDPTADTIVEANETVALTLAAGTGYTVGTTAAVTGTITNDDVALPTITLAVSPASVTEDGTANLVYTFTRTGSTTNALTVNYGITGTAASTDYTGATPGTGKTITFAAGSSTATLTINPTADTTVESNETVALTLATGTGYTIGTTTAVTGTITNDDVALSTINLAVSPASVTEDGTGNLVYTFTRTGSTTNALTVNYGITGTAASTDYTGATPGTGKTITFAAGSSTATLTINPTADTIVEANETVALTLAAGTGYTVGTTAAVTGTITNDDVALPTITLALSPASVTEDGTGNLVYTFTRTGSTTNALTVNYSIAGTAASTDYTGATPGTGKTITFAAGSSTATLTIDPTADTTVEANETVALTLATGTGYTVGTTTVVTGTITNDDVAPSVTINLSADQTIVEGRTNPQNVSYTVTLSSTSTQTITVQYATANGTAIAGSDYTSKTGTLTFNPGVTTQSIILPILNDSINEANETFTVTLTSPTNAGLGTKTSATTTITDTLVASVTTTLPTNVENLTLTGTTAINGTGNAGDNVFKGNSANNTLTGLNGNDTYSFVANTVLGTDKIVETATGGIDTIDFSGTTTSVNVNLGVITSQTVNSNLKLILSANNVIENATGGTGNDRLTGNALDNLLIGGEGNDQLQGLAGNDILWGGLGDDLLNGGLGNDQYRFQGNGVFSTSLGVDYITQFDAGQDKIVLSKTTFNAVTNSVGQALTNFAVVTDDALVNANAARIVYSQSSGSLFYNQDGNVLGAATVFEFARLGNLDITLASSDFSLIA
ncbi:beta strand repeat-containing protein [Anabaena catenula]|uniref:M10 family metallopeptidase C-terminal domain-containing protein n=1 Tax=Anabaena catenula FACHB-362 TaxID=2692877 RepID=A0ABR8IX75_9NOST|nr:Calx-beta domain-containing protein [Anabaena catenula]MBD2690670.1 M10 family metallopeptidase C-terminal domain-containing protein [Anabaena catenula FACHB-362]